MTNPEQFQKIAELAKKADALGLMIFDRMSLIMDLKVAHEQFDLRLDDLLNADNQNFAHDIIGIQRNMDRENKEVANLFVPRYASNEVYENERKIATVNVFDNGGHSLDRYTIVGLSELDGELQNFLIGTNESMSIWSDSDGSLNVDEVTEEDVHIGKQIHYSLLPSNVLKEVESRYGSL